MISTLLLLSLTASAPNEQTQHTQSFEAVKTAYRPSDAILLDRHGVPLHEHRVSNTGRRLSWIALSDVSPTILEALLRSEDKRFFQHSGVDWQAVAQAALDNLQRERPRGASTLTMQLVGLMNESLQLGEGERSQRSWSQKITQANAALSLEQRWDKLQVLEAYLNLVPLRGELQGIDAAMRLIFNRESGGATRDEAAIIVALVRQPNVSPKQIGFAACEIAKRTWGSHDCVTLQALAQERLSKYAQRHSTQIEEGWRERAAPHVARMLLTGDQHKVTSTLVAPVQHAALTAVERQLAELSKRNVSDAAVVVLDNASGEVLAYVGSGGRYSSTPELDGAKAMRQAGSTLKPFLYEQAIEAKLLTAATLIDDSPAAFDAASGQYIPRNYDKVFRGPTSTRYALGNSLNIPAVRAVSWLGVQRFHERLQALSLAPLAKAHKKSEQGDWYGYSLALGSIDVSLLNLTNAYRTLANGGRTSDVSFVIQQGSPTFNRVMDEGAAFITADMMSDAAARAQVFGTDSLLATRVWAGVKTGTSKDMRDNWCIGFTSRFTIGVWVGNFDGSPMRDVSGVSGAAPIWAELVHVLHRDFPSVPPQAPAGLEQQRVSFEVRTDVSRVQSPSEAPRNEWFLAGTAQAVQTFAEESSQLVGHRSHSSHRIRYPADGAILAVDKDIPAANQFVPVEVSGDASALRVELVKLQPLQVAQISESMTIAKSDALSASAQAFANRSVLSKTTLSSDRPLFKPERGQFLLRLVDKGERVVDAVGFEVR